MDDWVLMAEFKLSVIEDAESTTKRATARKFKVDECRIREWRQKKSDPSLLAPPSSKRRPRIVAASSHKLKKLGYHSLQLIPF